MPSLLLITCQNLRYSPHYEAILPFLAEAGWDIDVIGDNASQSCLIAAIPHRRRSVDLPPLSKGRVGREYHIARAIITSQFKHYDVVVLSFTPTGVRGAVWLNALLKRTRLVYLNLDFCDPREHPVMSRLEGRMCRLADLSYHPEPSAAEVYRVLHRIKSPVRVMPPTLPRAWPIMARNPTMRSRLADGEDASRFVLMHHGAFNPNRGGEEILRAMTLLPKRFRLVLTASSATSKGAVRARELGVFDRVTLLPKLEFAEMLNHTANADAGLALYTEGGLKERFHPLGRIMEYVMTGTPVICTALPSSEAIVNRHGLGIPLDRPSPDALAAAVLEIEARKLRGEFVGTHLRRAFEESFALDVLMPSVIEDLQSLV